MPSVDQWPFEVSSFKDGVTRFKPVDVTVKAAVARKSDNSFWGWKFEEDTTKVGEYVGVVWGAPQEWDDKTGAYLPYKGPRYPKGTRMTVELAMSEKGKDKFYNVRMLTLASVDVDDQPPAANQDVAQAGAIPNDKPVPAEWTLPITYWRERQALERRSIQMQTTFNGLVAILNAETERHLAPTVLASLWRPADLDRMMYQVRTLVLMLVPGLPESEGAQAARTDAELGDDDLPWSDGDGAKAWPATQPEMQTGAAVKQASH